MRHKKVKIRLSKNATLKGETTNETHEKNQRGRCSNFILLMDGKIHTQKEIASKIEVNRKTIYRGIERLRLVFIIHTFRDGSTGGGIYLDPQHIYYGLMKSQKKF